MSAIRTTTSPPGPPRSVARSEDDGRVVLAAPSHSLRDAGAREQVAAAAGLPRRVVDVLATQGEDVPLGPPLPPSLARERLLAVRHALPAAVILDDEGASGWRPALGLILGAGAATVIAGGLAILGQTLLALVLGGAALALGAAALVAGARRLARPPSARRSLAALDTARAALPGPAAAWEAVAALRRTLGELGGLPRAELSAALDQVEDQLAAGEDAGPRLAELHAAFDALHAPGSPPTEVPALANLARAARAARDEVDGR